jgi:hypothetical protein
METLPPLPPLPRYGFLLLLLLLLLLVLFFVSLLLPLAPGGDTLNDCLSSILPEIPSFDDIMLDADLR